jgi:hypothetical protein
MDDFAQAVTANRPGLINRGVNPAFLCHFPASGCMFC